MGGIEGGETQKEAVGEPMMLGYASPFLLHLLGTSAANDIGPRPTVLDTFVLSHGIAGIGTFPYSIANIERSSQA